MTDPRETMTIATMQVVIKCHPLVVQDILAQVQEAVNQIANVELVKIAGTATLGVTDISTLKL